MTFKKIDLAVAARMAESRGSRLSPGALGISASSQALPPGREKGKAELVVVLQVPPSQPPSNRAGVLMSV